MESSRFDTWSRRRVGLAAGGLAAWLAGLVGVQDALAKKKRKKRCKARGRGCNPGGKRKCCNGLRCAPDTDLGGNRCCRKEGHACAAESECCSGFCLDDRCQPAECREIGNPCDIVIPCCSGNCGANDHCEAPLA